MQKRSNLSTSDLFSTNSDEKSSNSEEIHKYVEEFKQEVETKFQKSKSNKKFVFPRKIEKKDQKDTLRNESNDSLKDVLFYDLESQNIKKALLREIGSKKKSETITLVDVISKLGKLDTRYLTSQLKNCESSFFRILYQAIQNKVSKEPKYKDSLKSCSIKTKQIFMPEKQKVDKSIKKEENSLSFQKHFIPSDYTSRQPSTKLPSMQALVNSGQNKKLTSLENNHKEKNVTMSPRDQKNKAVYSLKPLKSEKQFIKAKPNLMKSNFVKTSGNNSLSQAKLQSSKFDNNSVFQAIKSNILNSKVNLNKSKSRLKLLRNDAENHINQLKSKISLTKDQLRNLIQKNIYKGSNLEQSNLPMTVSIKTELIDQKKKTLVNNLFNGRGKNGN